MICAHCSAENREGAHICTQCGSELEGPDLLLGREVLGRYRVVSLIGEGGMGRVYLAEQRVGTTTRKVAIKTLRPQLSADKQLARRFFREAETIVRLTHPNIIQFFDFGELDDHTLVIVMEYIQGRSLAAELANGPLSPERADRVFTQICGALAEAHSQGIVHRDLKPDNILLTERGGQRDFVKVLDFGIAKISHSDQDEKATKLTQQGMMVGTPPYMSPEQFGAESIDARSDIYSLGVIAYEMLTGKLPFMAKTPWEWASKHLTAEPEPLVVNEASGISARRAQAIRRALAKSREQRPQDVAQLLHEFTSAGAIGFTGTMLQPSVPPGAAPVLPTPVHASSGAAFPAPPSSSANVPRPPSGAQQPAPPETIALPTQSRTGLWIGGAVTTLAALGFAAFALLRVDSTPPPALPSAPAVASATLAPQPPAAPPPHQAAPVDPPPTLLAAKEVEMPSQDWAARSDVHHRESGAHHRARESAATAPVSGSSAGSVSAASSAPPAPAPTDHPNLVPIRTIGPAQPSASSPARDSASASAPSSDRAPVRVLVPPDLQKRIDEANAVARDHVEQAVAMFQAAQSKFGADAPGLSTLRSTIARYGDTKLRELTLGSRCAQAQSFYRSLAGIGAAPPKERYFGKSCPFP